MMKNHFTYLNGGPIIKDLYSLPFSIYHLLNSIQEDHRKQVITMITC